MSNRHKEKKSDMIKCSKNPISYKFKKNTKKENNVEFAISLLNGLNKSITFEL